MQHDLQKRATRSNNIATSIAQHVAAASSSRNHCTDTSPGQPPRWIADFHPSHDFKYGAGLVFCARCGSVAANDRKSRLHITCGQAWEQRPEHRVSFELPTGSAGRLRRALQGLHPDYLATHWTDGRPASVRIRLANWEHPKEKVQDPQPSKLIDPED